VTCREVLLPFKVRFFRAFLHFYSVWLLVRDRVLKATFVTTNVTTVFGLFGVDGACG
jgi:hypothetical protein